MAASVTKEVEALVDLFLSPTFDPFEPESSATCMPPEVPDSLMASGGQTGDRRPGALKQTSLTPPPPPPVCHEVPPEVPDSLMASGGQTGDRRPGALKQTSLTPPPPPQVCHEVDDEGDGLEYEAAVGSDTEDENEEEDKYVQPGILSEQTRKHCGQILAKMGDEFFKSSRPSQSSASAAPTWSNISEQLKSVFIKLSQLKDTDPDAERKKEEGWRDFKAILNSAVSDNVAGDAFKLLGALLLSLHGLAGMVSGIKGLARSYFIRYIRERELDVEMQRLGGLNHLMQQELD